MLSVWGCPTPTPTALAITEGEWGLFRMAISLNAVKLPLVSTLCRGHLRSPCLQMTLFPQEHWAGEWIATALIDSEQGCGLRQPHRAGTQDQEFLTPQ